MTGIIQGKDVVIYFQGGTGYELFGCASDISVTVETELKSVKTKGNGVWKKQAQQTLSWQVTMNSIVKFDNNVNSWDLLANQMQFVNVNVRMLFMSGSQVKRLEGELIIQSTQLAGTPNDLLKGSFTMPGNGELKMYDNNGVCAAMITDATINVSIAPSGGITFTASSDTEYISYQLYRLGTLLEEGTVYKPSFFAHRGLTGGASNYNVTATPYCITDVAGADFTKQF